MTKQEKAKDARLQREYHVTLEEWKKVYEYQNGACAICKHTHNKKGEKLVLSLDHCHTTGLCRGLLCFVCNRAIARFYDELQRFKNAVYYFEHNPFTVVLGQERFTAPGKIGTKLRKKKLAAMKAVGKGNDKTKKKCKRRIGRKV